MLFMRINQKREDLPQETLLLLGKKLLDDITDWYKQVLDAKTSYVVFIVQRSYLLALIMERITDRKMNDCHDKVFLTDSAFFLQCQELAEYYKKNKNFPSIMIVEDVVLHGSNVAYILSGIEQRLCDILANEYDSWMVQEAFLNAINIHVLAVPETPLVQLQKYEMKISSKYYEELAFLHHLSTRLCTLVWASNITNACYVYSEEITPEDYLRIDKADFVSTDYRGGREDTWIKYVKSNAGAIAAVFTVRIIKNVNNENYRVVPLVFLPNLDHTATQGILQFIFSNILQDSTIADIVYMWDSLEGKRSCNEFITLVLSNILLKEFNENNNITINLNENAEYAKLARNYFVENNEKSEMFIRKVLNDMSGTVEELESALLRLIPNVYQVLELQPYNLIEKTDEEIKISMEDFFHEWKKTEEIERREQMQLRRNAGLGETVKIKRYSRGSGFVLKELNQRYSERSSRVSIAFFLQMMDAGVASLSALAPEAIKVVGYAQYVKAGELSLAVKQLRIIEFIPMLKEMQYECGIEKGDLDRKVVALYESGIDDVLNTENTEKIREFIKSIEEMNQTVLDWTGDYWAESASARRDNTEEGNEAEFEHYNKLIDRHRELYLEYRHKNLVMA